MKLLLSTSSDYELIPFFIEHYARLGITEILNVAYTDVDSSSIDVLESCTRGTMLKTWRVVNGNSHVAALTRDFHAMRDACIGEKEWYMIADLDEFYEFSGPVETLIERAEAINATCVRGHFLDRVAMDGSLPYIADDLPLSAQFPLGGDLTKVLLQACTSKIMLVKGRLIAIDSPHHWCTPENPVCTNGIVHHYKWTGSLMGRLEKRAARNQKLGYPYWHESNRVVTYLRRHGRIKVEDARFGFRRVGG